VYTEIPDLADLWLTHLIIQSLVETVYQIEFEIEDPVWDPGKVKYCPIWTRNFNTKQKCLAGIYITFDSWTTKRVSSVDLSTLGLIEYEELFDLMRKSRAKRVKLDQITKVA